MGNARSVATAALSTVVADASKQQVDCHAAAEADRRPRAYVLDSDLGWDVDDVLALIQVALHCRRTGEPLAVMSNSEHDGTEHRPGPRVRARAMRWILQRMGCADADVLVAAGGISPGVEPFAEGLRAAVDAALPDTPGCVADAGAVRAFVQEQHTAGRQVVWLGIGAMTNLAALLGHVPGAAAAAAPPRLVGARKQAGGPGGSTGAAVSAGGERAAGRPAHWPDSIFQQGPRGGSIGTNARLDPDAFVFVVENAQKLGIPLTLVPSDTTGFGLGWVDEETGGAGGVPGNRFGEGLPARLRDAWLKVPGAEEAILANITAGASGLHYYGASAIHDPLTVLVAVHGSTGAKAVARCVPARVHMDESGYVDGYSVPAAELESRQREVGDLYGYWPARARIFRHLSPDDPGNCKMTLGPLSVSEVDRVAQRLEEMLEV